MILPFEQAKAVARGATQILYLPVRDDRKWRPRTSRSEPAQSRHGRKLETHGKVLIGIWEITTLRPLLEPSALKARQAAGWRVGDGITQMCDDWMRAHDPRWPQHDAVSCEECDETGVTGDEDCVECAGEGWHYHERDVTEADVWARFERLHADRAVYAIVVSPDRVEPARLLSPAGRPRGDELGYTENPAHAMLDAGEAVPLGYQNKISEEAQKRDDDRRRERGEGRDIVRAKRSSERYARRKKAA